MRNLLSRFKRWWIAVLAVLLIILVALGVFGLLGGSVQVAEENQRIATVRMGTLTKQVTIDGSIAFSSKKTLTFASQGFVDEILVGEGEEVKAGQPLARLDPESVARLQQAVAQARLDLLDAQDALAKAQNPARALAEAEKAVSDAKLALRDAERQLDALLAPAPHDLARAEKAVADAKSALRNAWAEFDALLTPQPYAVAQAEQAVADARVALQDAQNSLGGGVDDAQADVNAALRDLDAARHNLSDTKNNERLSEQRKAVDDKAKVYAAAIAKWTGAEPTPEELGVAPDVLFARWDFDPAHGLCKGIRTVPLPQSERQSRHSLERTHGLLVESPTPRRTPDQGHLPGIGRGADWRLWRRRRGTLRDGRRQPGVEGAGRRPPLAGRAANAARQRGSPSRGWRDTR